MSREEIMKSYDNEEYTMKDYKEYEEKQDTSLNSYKDTIMDDSGTDTSSCSQGESSDTDNSNNIVKGNNGGTKTKRKSPIKKIVTILIIVGIFLFIKNNEDIKIQIADLFNIKITNSEDYILLNSNKKYLSEDDLIGYSKEELGFIRNEIFARYGFVFGNNKYKTYFESKPWYTPNPNFKGDYEELNKYEEHNVELILRLEDR